MPQHHEVADILLPAELTAEKAFGTVGSGDLIVGFDCALAEEGGQGAGVVDGGHGGGGGRRRG